MESAESEFLTLYDSHWFEMELFRSTTSSSSESPPDSPTLASMYLQIQNQKQHQPPPPPAAAAEGSNLRRPLNRSTMIRSISDDVYSKPTFESGGFDSPDSVLPPPPEQRKPMKKGDSNKNKIEGSKSLTALEIEELKGFMDLGFVFSEKDTDFSRLVSILPGLQRLGKTETSAVAVATAPERPYLSEAWAVKEEQRKKKKEIVSPLMNLRDPARNEVELKDRLRLWAQTVASTVR